MRFMIVPEGTDEALLPAWLPVRRSDSDMSWKTGNYQPLFSERDGSTCAWARDYNVQRVGQDYAEPGKV